ncbi:MAG: hypothetical protein M1514_03640 [Patescibacteria group bacterium]|nr:hypothetical protein [Patescibacteria group bacterium]
MKRNYSEAIFVIATLTLTITVLWVYLSVFRALNKTEKPILSAKETKVLNPVLDKKVFEELKMRKY